MAAEPVEAVVQIVVEKAARTEVAEPGAAVVDKAAALVAARIEVPEQTAAVEAEQIVEEQVRTEAVAAPRIVAEAVARMSELGQELVESVRPAARRLLGAIHSEDMPRQLPPVAPTNGPGNCHKRLQT